MLDKGQEQTVEGGSVAIQAAGNVTYGATVTEMRATFELLMQANFPILREEARATAQTCAQEFIGKMEEKIVQAAESVDVAKFRDPDVQSTMNDAVQAAARRGEAANQDILCELIAQRVTHGEGAFKDIVISEAVQVTPKLTSPLISAITLNHFIQAIKINNTTPFVSLDYLAGLIEPLCKDCEGISRTHLAHIHYAGAGSVNMSVVTSAYDVYLHAYKELDLKDTATARMAISAYPALSRLCELYETNHIGTVSLTSVGQAIALANLASKIPKLNFSTWLY